MELPGHRTVELSINSLASGNEDIWIMNADGTGQSQLTVDPGTDDNCCEVSPDGRYVVFRSQRGDGTSLEDG